MRKINLLVISTILLLFTVTSSAKAHCEIPCGIYGDSIRIKLLYEHISTIEKSINKINALDNSHDIVRWVINKEEHAKKIQEIASQYFMHQRIKPADKSDKKAYQRYIKQLTLMHKIQIYAMKSKQSTNPDNIKKLRELVHKFEHAYFD
jgi:nickel superoxide dismutase